MSQQQAVRRLTSPFGFRLTPLCGKTGELGHQFSTEWLVRIEEFL